MPPDPAQFDGLRVRRAMPADAGVIGRIYVETWRASYAGILPDRVLVGMTDRSQSRMWRAAIAGRDRVLVAERRGRGVVGFGSVGPARDPALGYAGEVYTLYVRPDEQNQGIGRSLLRNLFDALRSAGHDSALIWVLAANPSRFFYERMGGVRVAERMERLWGADQRETGYGWSSLRPPREER